MKKIIFRYITIIATLITLSSFQIGTLQNSIVSALKDNNAKDIAKHFNTSISLQINQRSSISTKYQAELVLADFLKNNRVVEVSGLNTSNSNQDRTYIILDVRTAKKSFKFFMKTIEIKDDVLISELKVN